MTSENGRAIAVFRRGPVHRGHTRLACERSPGCGIGCSLGFQRRCRLAEHHRLPSAKAKRVRHHAHRAARHSRRGNHGVQGYARERERTGRHGDADHIVNERPEQVLLDIAHGRARKRDRRRHIGQVAFHEHDVGAVDSDIGARADRNADIGARQGGSVVHAVSHHGNCSLFLQVANDLFLTLRQHAGNDVIGADAFLDGVRRALVVAREHDGPDTHARELGERCSASGLGLVSQRDKARERAIDREEEHRLALVGKAPRLFACKRRIDIAVFHEPRIAGETRATSDNSAKPAAGNLLEALDFLRHRAARLGVRHDCLRKRVLRALLEGVGKGKEGECLSVNLRALNGFGSTQSLGSPDSHEQFTGLFGSCGTRFVSAIEAICRARDSAGTTRGARSAVATPLDHQHLAYLGRALRDGSCLVENDRLHAVRGLQRLCRLHEDAVRSTASRPHHDGGRGGEPQSARARDNEHADRVGKSGRHTCADKHPDDEGDKRNRDDHGHEHARNLVGELFDRRLRACRLVDHAHDPGEHGVCAHALGAHGKPSRAVHRRTRNRSPHALFHRYAFARNDGLVDRARTFDHHSVDRHARTGANDEDIPRSHLIDRDFFLGTVDVAANRRFRREVHKLRNRVGGLSLRARLEVLAQRDQREDHRRRLEVQIHRRHVREINVAVSHSPADTVDRDDAVDRRGSRPQRDERVHVRRAVEERLETHAEELEVHENHGQQEQELGKCEREHVLMAQEDAGDRPPEHVAHG